MSKGQQKVSTGSKASSRIQQQAQAREAIRSERRRKRALRAGHQPDAQSSSLIPVIDSIKTFKFVLKGTRDEGMESLKKATTLHIYKPLFKYEDNHRKAVVRGGFEFEAPFTLISKILKELQPVWQFGKREDGSDAKD